MIWNHFQIAISSLKHFATVDIDFACSLVHSSALNMYIVSQQKVNDLILKYIVDRISSLSTVKK